MRSDSSWFANIAAIACRTHFAGMSHQQITYFVSRWHAIMPLDLEALTKASERAFVHDVTGMIRHASNPLGSCFRPYCAK